MSRASCNSAGSQQFSCWCHHSTVKPCYVGHQDSYWNQKNCLYRWEVCIKQIHLRDNTYVVQVRTSKTIHNKELSILYQCLKQSLVLLTSWILPTSFSSLFSPLIPSHIFLLFLSFPPSPPLPSPSLWCPPSSLLYFYSPISFLLFPLISSFHSPFQTLLLALSLIHLNPFFLSLPSLSSTPPSTPSFLYFISFIRFFPFVSLYLFLSCSSHSFVSFQTLSTFTLLPLQYPQLSSLFLLSSPPFFHIFSSLPSTSLPLPSVSSLSSPLFFLLLPPFHPSSTFLSLGHNLSPS